MICSSPSNHTWMHSLTREYCLVRLHSCLWVSGILWSSFSVVFVNLDIQKHEYLFYIEHANPYMLVVPERMIKLSKVLSNYSPELVVSKQKNRNFTSPRRRLTCDFNLRLTLRIFRNFCSQDSKWNFHIVMNG